MTSSPLFMSVAESMEILPPIAHVGCVERLLDGDLREVGPGAPAERAAAGGEHELLDRAGRLAGQELEQRRVLGVHREQLGSGRLRQGHHELAADDERLLVGQGEIDPLPQRRRPSDRARPSRPGRSARGRRRTRARAGRAPPRRRAPRRRSTPRRPGRRRPGRRARSGATPVARAWATSGSQERSALRPTSSSSPCARETTSSAWVPMEPVEPRTSRRRGIGCMIAADPRPPPGYRRRASVSVAGAAPLGVLRGDPDAVVAAPLEHLDGRHVHAPGRPRADAPCSAIVLTTFLPAQHLHGDVAHPRHPQRDAERLLRTPAEDRGCRASPSSAGRTSSARSASDAG